MKIPLVGRKYKIVAEINPAHDGNNIGDIITCSKYCKIGDDYIEFQSLDLFWDGIKISGRRYGINEGGFGLVPAKHDQQWQDVVELVED